jgi:hypothetical protein
MINIINRITMEIPGNGNLFGSGRSCLGLIRLEYSVIKVLAVNQLVRPIKRRVERIVTAFVDDGSQSETFFCNYFSKVETSLIHLSAHVIVLWLLVSLNNDRVSLSDIDRESVNIFWDQVGTISLKSKYSLDIYTL